MVMVDKKRRYHTDYINNPPRGVDFIPGIISTSGRLHSEFIRILFLQDHLRCSNLGLEIFSTRLQIYVLILIYMGCLSHRSLTLTPHTPKLLVY
jgi:hypothetical protein